MNTISNESKIKRKRNEDNNDPIDGERKKCARKSNNSSFKNSKTTQTIGRTKREVCFSVAPLGAITRSKTRVLGESNSSATKNGMQIDEKQETNINIQNKWKSCANDKSSENFGLSSNNSVSKIKNAITIPTPASTVTRSKTRALGDSNSNAQKNGIKIDEKPEINNDIKKKLKSFANDKSSENFGLSSNNSVSKIENAITIPTPASTVTRSKTRALGDSNSNAQKNGIKIDEKPEINNDIKKKWKSCANDKSSENFGLSSNNSVSKIENAITIPTPASTVTRPKTRALAVDAPLRVQKSNCAIEKTASVKIGDLVWSKLTGWPYWPSTVEAIMPDGMIRVRFIEKKSRYADVKITNIVTFVEGCFDKKIKAHIQKNATLTKCVKDAITKMIALDLMKTSYDHV